MTTDEILAELIRAVFTGEKRDDLLADLEGKNKKSDEKKDDEKSASASASTSSTVRKA